MPKPIEAKSQFEVVKSWIVGLTGVFLVIPALVNGGIDIYSSWQKLPKTKAEQLNEVLFKKYFKKQPVAAFPVPIKQSNGTVEVKFSVYDEGDVYVEFGDFYQWFPFPGTDKKTVASFLIVDTAIAQEQPQLRGFGRFQQSEQFTGANISRERLYENGVIERSTLNPKTGAILESSTSKTLPPDISPPPSEVSRFAPIDLDAAHTSNSQQSDRVASICITQVGTCQMISAIPIGSHCVCYNAMGLVPGVAK